MPRTDRTVATTHLGVRGPAGSGARLDAVQDRVLQLAGDAMEKQGFAATAAEVWREGWRSAVGDPNTSMALEKPKTAAPGLDARGKTRCSVAAALLAPERCV